MFLYLKINNKIGDKLKSNTEKFILEGDYCFGK